MAQELNEIRKEINRTLLSRYTCQKLEENYTLRHEPGRFKRVFLDPWKNVWDQIKIEAKKFVSQVLTTFRLMTTINQKKAEEIVANQRTRLKNFNQQTKAIRSRFSDSARSEIDYYDMLYNPASYIARKASEMDPIDLRELSKELALNDEEMDSLAGGKSEIERLRREREGESLAKKAMRELEQLFFAPFGLAANRNIQGTLINESIASSIENKIYASEVGRNLEELASQFNEGISELMVLIKALAAQNQFIASIANLDSRDDPKKTLAQIEQAINALDTVDPDSAKSLKSIPQNLRNEINRLTKDEKFLESLTDKQVPEVEAYSAVIGSLLRDGVSGFVKQAEENKKMLDETLSSFFPDGMDSETIDIINNELPGFRDSMRVAERMLGKSIIA
jgi:hypothetical protein